MGGADEFPFKPVKRHFIGRATVTDIPPNIFNNDFLGVLDYYEPDSPAVVSIVQDRKGALAIESNKRREMLSIGGIADIEVLRKEPDCSYTGVVLGDDYPLYAEEAGKFFDLNEKIVRGRVFRTADEGSPLIRAYTNDFSVESGFLVVNRNTAGFKREIQEEVIKNAFPGGYVIAVKSKERAGGVGFYYPVTRIQDSFGLLKNGNPIITRYEGGTIYDLPLLSLSEQGDGCKGTLCVHEFPYNSKFVPVIVPGTSSRDLGSLINAKIVRKDPSYLIAKQILG